jgi:hypothetical protein
VVEKCAFKVVDAKWELLPDKVPVIVAGAEKPHWIGAVKSISHHILHGSASSRPSSKTRINPTHEDKASLSIFTIFPYCHLMGRAANVVLNKVCGGALATTSHSQQ